MIVKTVLSISQTISARKFNSRNSECINLCDVGEKFNNTKNPTNNLLLELECQSNEILGIRELVWNVAHKKHENKQV